MAQLALLIVDDHPVFADGFVAMVRTLRPTWGCTIARSAFDAVEKFEHACFDLVVVDAGLPGEDGIALVRRLAALRPDLPQIVISGRADLAMQTRARGCGARGFLAKTVEPDAIVRCIDTVVAGGTCFDLFDEGERPTLTHRQIEVLELLVQGHGNKEIRYRLGIAERTVRAHLTELFHLLGVGSRMQAVIRARELGLVE